MHSRRSQEIALIPYNPEIEKTLRKLRKQRKEMGERAVENNRGPVALRDYLAPIQFNTPSCITLPEMNARNFELKPATIQLLPTFHGFEREDPYLHVKDFFDICATFKYEHVTDEQIRLRLFPFSLKDRAKAWLNSLDVGSITSWDQLVSKFLSKFFPAQKTNALRREIMNFTQTDEHFYECWERFRDLLLKCPHHGFEKWQLVQYFYESLTPQNRRMVDATCGGALMGKSPDEAWTFFEVLRENSQQWDYTARGERASPVQKKAGMYEISTSAALEEQVASLARQMKTLAQVVAKTPVEVCAICSSSTHHTNVCPSNPLFPDDYAEQANAVNTFRRPGNDPYSNTYNQGWTRHPNLSWSPNNLSGMPRNPPMQPYPTNNQGFQSAPAEPKKPTLEDTLQQFMQSTMQFQKITEQALQENQRSHQANSQSISKLEVQVGQIATALGEREKGRFPSQSIVNPKSQCESSINYQEHAKAITTLRSGRIVDNKVGEVGDSQKEDDEEEKSDKSVPSMLTAEKSDLTPLATPRYVTKPPYPQRLINPKKKDRHMTEILELFRKVQINIPLLDAIKQIPAYAKFLKELCTNKRKFEEHEKVLLSEEVSAVLQRKLPPKLKDPGSFTISCIIGDHHFKRALMDLGASVNLMPYSVYKQLGLGELKPTSVTLELADRSVKYPRGIVEDVLVKVDQFILPADFIILDTESTSNLSQEVPIIMGRPFMATAGTIIDVQKGLLTMTVGGITIEFKVFEASRRPSDVQECCFVDVVDNVVRESFILNSSPDPLETCLVHYGMDFSSADSVSEVNAVLDTTSAIHINKWQPRFESLPPSHNKLVPSIEMAPKLELKPLPVHLKYAYLGSSETLPVIIASDLGHENEEKLLKVLKEHKTALGWTIADIKGISPTMCMHRIHLEDNVKPTCEMQRRLNPHMK